MSSYCFRGSLQDSHVLGLQNSSCHSSYSKRSGKLWWFKWQLSPQSGWCPAQRGALTGPWVCCSFAAHLPLVVAWGSVCGVAEQRCSHHCAVLPPGMAAFSKGVKWAVRKAVTTLWEQQPHRILALLRMLSVPPELLLICLCVHLLPLALMAAGTSIFCSVKMTCCLWMTGCSTQRLTPCQSTTQTLKLKQACNSEAIAQHPAPTTSAGYCISFPLKEFVLFLKWYFGALVQFRTVFYWEDETMK